MTRLLDDEQETGRKDEELSNVHESTAKLRHRSKVKKWLLTICERHRKEEEKRQRHMYTYRQTETETEDEEEEVFSSN